MKFHILYYEKPLDTVSKGTDIPARTMVEAIQSFQCKVEHARILACFDKEAFIATPAFHEDKALLESADKLHEDLEKKEILPERQRTEE